ncbi:MAG: cytochrome c biogenesis protein ResB [Jiangellaceae bacterium]|nr:cytochrome c biogenesis protein ResB [Jiangellaceae bacterium]
MTVREASAATAPPPGRPPALSAGELAAWVWRQLTSMRVALVLLLLLGIAAIPGSLVPQRDANPLAVGEFRTRNPQLAQWYERLGLFDVYSTPWFAAIYIALVVSLVGCIVPRSVQHWRAGRTGLPPAPRNLSRLPAYGQLELAASRDDVLAAARAELRSHRFRVAFQVAAGGRKAVERSSVGSTAREAADLGWVSGPEPGQSRSGRSSGPETGERGIGRPERDSWRDPSPRIAKTPGRSPASGLPAEPAGQTASDSLAAEAGRLHETGNLVFHLALVLVLVAVAAGSLFGYRATVLVPEGSGFANSVIQYDTFSAGALFDPQELPPFALELDRFRMEFVADGAQVGAPQEFEATVRFTAAPGAAEETRTVRVNEPLEAGGTLVHLLNPGYAPAITVRDADGNVLAEGPVPFLPQDDSFTSLGVRKVPVAADVGQGEDIGIQGLFLPTAVVDEQGPRSVFPEPRNPALFFTAFHGNLGLDDGQPQSVYRLDTSGMEQFRSPDGGAFRAALSVGETATLPDGYGSVTFDGYVTWANFQVSRNAGKELVLTGAVLALGGLLLSLYVRRRRMFVRVERAADRTVVEVAGLERSGGGPQAEVDEIVHGIARRLTAGSKV